MPATTSTLPRLSIGLPVYNGERYLAGTLDSLLQQTFADFELIISDNASTDGTANICREYAASDPRIRYYRSDSNRGAAWNFNNAFNLARGELFKWAAHDDLHDPRFLAECVSALDHDPTAVLCFTRTLFIDDDGHVLREYPFPVDVASVTRRRLFLVYAGGGHIVHEIFGVIRKSALEGTALIGGYVGSDLILLGTLALKGRFIQVQEPLFQHREHLGRSTVATGGTEGFTHWYDSSKSGRFAMPFWRRLLESTRCVLRSGLPTSEKAAMLADVGRAANWNRQALHSDLRRVIVRRRAS